MTHPAEARRMAHRHGPAAEHVNAEHMVKSGKAASNRELVLAAIRENRARTAGELAKLTGLSPVEVRRRFSELKSDGLAWHGEMRTCSVEGTPQHELMAGFDAKQGSLL